MTEEQRLNRRRTVTDATIRLIVRDGVAQVAMSDIITESGLSAGAIYSHFESKDEILASVVERALTVVTAKVHALTQRHALPNPKVVVDSLVPELGTPDDAKALVQIWGHMATEPQLAPLVTDHVASLQESLRHYATAWLTENGVADETSHALLGELFMALGQARVVQCSFSPPFESPRFLDAIDALCAAFVLTHSKTTRPDTNQEAPIGERS